jgi:hypothetical protein
MPLLRVAITFRAWLLGPSRAFSKRSYVDPLGQIEQCHGHVRGAHAIKDVPLHLGDRDHHPVVRCGHFVGQLVERHLFIHSLLAMYAA